MTLDAQLAAFRAGHPPRTVVHEDVSWRYYKGGAGEPTIVLVTGALGLAELGFQVQTALERRSTVIAPDYPDLASARAMLAGLVAILDREGVRRAIWSGGSFGGLVVQRLIEQAPERVAGIVLSHTGPVAAARAPAWVLKLLEILPGSWVTALLERRLRGFLGAAPEQWYRWFDQAIGSFTRDRLIRRIRLSDALGRLPSGRPWTGPTLIVESDNDPAVRPAHRTALRAAFPRARVHRFAGTGHVAAILDPEGYADVVADFVATVPT